MTQEIDTKHLVKTKRSISAALEALLGDNYGTTAIEFGLLVIPFVAITFGILSFSLFFFTESAISTALTDASRSLRTGQFQTSTGAYAGTTSLSGQIAVLQAAMCKELPAEINCNKLVLLAQIANNYSSVTSPVCTSNGSLISQATANQTFNAGTANSIVLLTVCYPWKLGPSLPFLPKANLSDGSFLIQASVVLQVEPYN